MSVNLLMLPTVPSMNWEDFRQTYGEFSIAIDGFVRGAPCFDKTGPYANFDHHEGVNRLATRATCGQVFMAISQGLFTCFRDNNGPRADVFANDCDEDVCLSWYLFKLGCSPQKLEISILGDPILKHLVDTVDLIDTTSGICPIRLSTWEEIAWIFDPYRKFRLSGEIDNKNKIDFVGVVEEIEKRIIDYLTGSGKTIPLDTRYERISRIFLTSKGIRWFMVKETGAQARAGMFRDGILAYVSVRERSDRKSWAYSVGRISSFVPFDLDKIFSALNKAEGCTNDCWGGGDTIGGSPRVKGSNLSPEEVAKIIKDVLET